ncbi:FliI/YscN family ATPase [Paracoccus ravus]|uniref:FliI/YscN family ATPase n=1 Tax=Paracoccus ravus TaxID=2447760 RepID=UPI00106EBB98|nr:FliI/YscN family ATPase [Paracoccus ravus]
MDKIQLITAELRRLRKARYFGKVVSIGGGLVRVAGLVVHGSVGDRVEFLRESGEAGGGEIVAIDRGEVSVLPDGSTEGLSIGIRVELLFAPLLAPDDSWIGRVIDPLGRPLDGHPIDSGVEDRGFRAPPPPATQRKRLGERLRSGLAVFDTFLPIVRGQRIGLFAGSGVGKSTLLSALARGVEADVVVIAMIGERGRELREFIEEVLGPEGMKRAVIVAATSDQSPLMRRRCAWAGMTVAEHFRDQGKHVLFLADSVTRFAEAHREIALASGESPSYRGFPPSVSHLIMSLAERAGPGAMGSGDITAVFSVLVAGSDMEEPVADILRGVLDGHVVLDRSIAERGRFPAVDVLRSVSRSLPHAATEAENGQLARARAALGLYAESELMIRAGLYAQGTDARLDEAVRIYPALDAFFTRKSGSVPESFQMLSSALQPGR